MKNNFESVNSLMLSVTKAYLCSAFMEYAGLTTLDGTPKNINATSQPKALEEFIGSFVDEYVMLEFDVEKALRQQKEQAAKLAQANANSACNDEPSTNQPGTEENKN